VHYYEELVETIEMDILFTIFGAQNQEILIPHQNQVKKNIVTTPKWVKWAKFAEWFDGTVAGGSGLL
jgi:hypothetical protein